MLKNGKPETILFKDCLLKTNYHVNLPFNNALNSRAKALRKAGNYPEVVFWIHVHKGKFWKLDVDRQRVIGNYIVDFYIKALALVIEIDGASHNDKELYDQKRTDYLEQLGLKVYRISSYRVLHDLENVLKEVENYIIEHYAI